jgi:D-inositol-3-phosphate glycosyltransferase
VRVLYSFPHRVGAPGIGSIAEHQVRGLLGQGHTVSLYCMSVSCSLPGLRRLVRTLGVGRHRIPRRPFGFDRALAYHDWRVARASRVVAGEVDAIHCWGLGSVQTLAAARELGIHSFREVPNAHTEFAYQRAAGEAAKLGVRMPRGHSHIPNPRRLELERREFGLADTLLVPSDYVRDTFLERGFRREQLARHQYGFDPDRFPAPSTPEARVTRPLRACFVGHGEPRKGLHYALQAWFDSGVATTGRFVICGGFVPQYRKRLTPLLEHPSIETVGFQSDVGAVMRQADILMLPSLEEGSALVTYEAQASGCVLLVSDAAGALCRHADEALVHRAGDVHTLTEHLRRVDADRDMLARLRATTLARRNQLTWSAAAARLDEIYRARIK